MKKYLFFAPFSLILAFTITSCNKVTFSTPDDFDVSIPKSSYRVGDTVLFNFSGAPESIVFYSGEIGKRYANTNRVSLAGINKLVFQTSMQQGVTPPAISTDSLKLLISTNLSGYDSLSIAKATWTDITSRNTKWPTSLSTSFTTSDSVNISDFNTADKVNIAFRFKGKGSATIAQRKWQIQNLVLNNMLPDGTNTPLFSAPFLGSSTVSGSTIAPSSSFQYTGWVQCSFKNLANAWNVGTAGISGSNAVNNSSGIAIRTSYPITFDPGVAPNLNDNDDWLITTAVDLKTVKPDAGVVIKSLTTGVANVSIITLKKYKYVFNTPGTYIVTFVAQNGIASNSNIVVRQGQVSITP